VEESMVRSIGRLAALVSLCLSGAFAGPVFYSGSVTEIWGPNSEGIPIGSPISVYLDYEIVTTPLPELMETEDVSFEDAVYAHAATIAETYMGAATIYAGEIPGLGFPAWWVVRDLQVYTPYGAWDRMWLDVIFLYFDTGLEWRGFEFASSDIYVSGMDGAWYQFSGSNPGTYLKGDLHMVEGFSATLLSSDLVTSDNPEPATALLVFAALLALGVHFGRKQRQEKF
jgi:hypothetical protein